MKPDDKICYCYHVSLRKLINFVRREQPSLPSRMSECLNAGSGCGWCIPILRMIQQRSTDTLTLDDECDMEGLPKTPADYEAARKQYLKSDRKNSFD